MQAFFTHSSSLFFQYSMVAKTALIVNRIIQNINNIISGCIFLIPFLCVIPNNKVHGVCIRISLPRCIMCRLMCPYVAGRSIVKPLAKLNSLFFCFSEFKCKSVTCHMFTAFQVSMYRIKSSTSPKFCASNSCINAS